MATISACAVGSLSASRRFAARARTVPSSSTTTAPTGTCTTGTAMWVASTASALSVGANATGTAATNQAVIQAATLYKCTSTNTWTAYYTPYTYPHPLISGTDTTPPAVPTGISVVHAGGQ